MLLSLTNKGQWRTKWVVDSMSWPQLYKGLIESWKLWLNLCSLKWLKPSRSSVELGAGFMKWRIFFMRMPRSSLFYSEIVQRKKLFLRKLCFTLKMGMLCKFLEVWDECLTGIKWKNIEDPRFKNFVKKIKFSVLTSKCKGF